VWSSSRRRNKNEILSDIDGIVEQYPCRAVLLHLSGDMSLALHQQIHIILGALQAQFAEKSGA
jgi:hypothetical protein